MNTSFTVSSQRNQYWKGLVKDHTMFYHNNPSLGLTTLPIDCSDISSNMFTLLFIDVGIINSTPNRNLSRTTITIMTIITRAM